MILPCLVCFFIQAVSSASVFTDRLCIASKGKFNSQLSALDVLSCGPGDGCEGGSHIAAFKLFESVGIVTGGDYNSHEVTAGHCCRVNIINFNNNT